MRIKTRIVASILALIALPVLFAQTPAPPSAAIKPHLEKAQSLLRENRPDLAIPELQAAVALDPTNAETQGNLGVLLFFQNQIAPAIPHLRAAVERQSGLFKIQGLLGIAELRTQDLTAAQKDLESAFPGIPDRKFQTQVGLELAGLYTRQGELDESARIISQLRKSDPDNPEVLYAAYRTYTDLAGESMISLALRAPDSAQMQQIMAHEEARQGNTRGALAHYRKAIALNPHLPGIHLEFAELLNQSPDTRVKQEAEAEYRKALQDNPQDEKAELRLGDIEAHNGHAQLAFEHYSRAAQLDPSDADAKLGLAKSLIDRKQSDKAVALLEEAVKLEPSNAVVHYRLATLYQKSGHPEDAKREVELYKQYKEAKEKLRSVYQELMIHPQQIDTEDEAGK